MQQHLDGVYGDVLDGLVELGPSDSFNDRLHNKFDGERSDNEYYDRQYYFAAVCADKIYGVFDKLIRKNTPPLLIDGFIIIQRQSIVNDAAASGG